MKSLTEGASRFFRSVSRFLPAKHRRHILGDIFEEYQNDVLPRTGRKAEFWLWGRLVESIVTDAALRLRYRLSDRQPDHGAASDPWIKEYVELVFVAGLSLCRSSASRKTRFRRRLGADSRAFHWNRYCHLQRR